MIAAAVVFALLVATVGFWWSSAALIILGLYLLLLALWARVCAAPRVTAPEPAEGGELIDLSDVDWSAWDRDRRPAA